jgi:hypothetical protein
VDLDLAQVRAFLVTADQRHFSHAADTLFLTQQALSKRIRRLEDTLSVRLFLRTNRAVELTDDGERFLPHARELIRVADEALAAMGGDDKPLRLDVIDNGCRRCSCCAGSPSGIPSCGLNAAGDAGCAGTRSAATRRDRSRVRPRPQSRPRAA